MLLRVQHPDAHVDHPAGREILAFLALGRLVHEILEGVVDDVEIGVEKLPFLQGPDADLQMIGREPDAVVLRKDAGPFFAGIVKQGLNRGL